MLFITTLTFSQISIANISNTLYYATVQWYDTTLHCFLNIMIGCGREGAEISVGGAVPGDSGLNVANLLHRRIPGKRHILWIKNDPSPLTNLVYNQKKKKMGSGHFF